MTTAIENERNELKPCPFCGSDATCYDYLEPAIVEAKLPEITLWRVRCNKCYLGGDGIRTKSEAHAKWNRRQP